MGGDVKMEIRPRMAKAAASLQHTEQYMENKHPETVNDISQGPSLLAEYNHFLANKNH